MRAIIINAKDRTVTETEIDGSLKSLQQIVGGLIDTVTQGLDELHHCYVNDEGLLDHVGFTSAFAKEDKKALTARLEKLVGPPGFTGDAPGGPSRWATERSAKWQPLKTKLVVEVSFDHVTEGRFRHGTRLLRWRSDKAPEQCTREQIS